MEFEQLLMGHPGHKGNGIDLAQVGATLYYESGNEGRTELSDFNSTYENGHVVIASMHGRSEVLTARSLEHARLLQGNFNLLQEQVACTNEAVGVDIPLVEPAIVVVGLNEQFDPQATWQIHKHNPRRAIRLLNGMGGLYVNQRTDVQLNVMEQIATATGRRLHLNGARESASLTRDMNNKQHYVEMMRGLNGEMPAHVPTAVIAINDLPGTFEELLEELDLPAEWSPQDGIILKSAIDAGSEVMRFIYPDSYDDDIVNLVGQNQQKASNNHRDMFNIPLLAQPIICVPEVANDLKSFGVMMQIGEMPQIMSANSQIFNGPYYVGSLCDTEQEQLIIDSIGKEQLLHFATHIYNQTGYQGIAVFDGMNDVRFGPQLIYDGNYRQSAALYAVTLAGHLRNNDIRVKTLANVGYTGKFHCTDQAFMHEYMRKNGLLFNKSKGRGIIPIPNMNELTGYDLVFVNMDKQQIVDGWQRCAVIADYTEITDLHF